MRWSPTQYEIEWLGDRLQLMISSFVRHTNTNAYSSVNATPYRHTHTDTDTCTRVHLYHYHICNCKSTVSHFLTITDGSTFVNSVFQEWSCLAIICKKTTWQLKWQEIDWRKTLVTCYLVDKLLVGRLKKVRATKHVIHQCDFLGWLWSGFDGTSSDEEECDMTCDVFWRTTWSIDRRFWNTQSGAKIWSCVNVCF